MFDYFGQPVQLQYREYKATPDFPCVAFLHGEYPFLPSSQTLQFLHFHNLLEIGICHQGEHTLYLEDKNLSVHAGDIYLIPPYTMHIALQESDSTDDPACEYLYFSMEQMIRPLLPAGIPFPDIFKGYKQQFSPSVFSEQSAPELFHTISLILRELHQKQSDWQLAVRGLVLRLCMQIGEAAPSTTLPPAISVQNRAALNPALQYISQHYQDIISVEQLAQCCNMSIGHFQKLFQDCMHRTTHAYINLVRIEHACELLSSTETPILTIALETGFSSIATFNRQFKSIYHMTPRQWRNSRRKIKKKNISHSTFSHSTGT